MKKLILVELLLAVIMSISLAVSGYCSDAAPETSTPKRSAADFISTDGRFDLEAALAMSTESAEINLEIQSTGLWGHFADATTDGNLVYFNARFGLLVVDMSIPSSPTIVSRLFIEGYDDDPEDIAVSNGYAYLLRDQEGRHGAIHIIDISNPQTPTWVTKYEDFPNLSDIVVVGNRAYVADNDSGLIILDVSDPSNPTYLGGNNVNCRSLAIIDTLAIAGSNDSLVVFDISAPSSPIIIGHRRFVGSGSIRDIKVASDGVHLFALTPDNWTLSIIVIDIADPTLPDSITTVVANTVGEKSEMALQGSYLFVGADDSLIVIDATIPSAPTVITEWELSGVGYRKAIFAGQTLVLYGTRQGALTINVSNPLSPTTVGEFRTYYLRDAVINGNRAYLADRYGIFVLDLSNPQLPVILNYVQLSGEDHSLKNLRVSGDSLFASCGSSYGNTRVHIFDIHDANLPSLQPLSLTFYQSGRLFASGNYLYVCDTALMICDLTSGPLVVGSYRNTDFQWNGCRDVWVRGDTAIVLNESTLDIVDVSNHSMPLLIGKCAHQTGAWTMSVQGDYIFTATRDSGLVVFDISNPLVPARIGGCDQEVYGKDIAIYNDYAFLTSDTEGVRIENISNPYSPYFVNAYASPYWGEALQVFGDYLLYVEEEGFIIFRIDSSPLDVEELDYPELPSAFGLSQNYPNPFNPETRIEFAVPRTSHVSINIYNVLGQRLHTLVNERLSAGHKGVTWNGKDDYGNSVSSGVYFYRLQTDDLVETKKMLLLK